MASRKKGTNRWGIEHLGVIPDGNRRWGRKHGVEPAWLAHTKGVEKMESFLDWCLDTKIPKVSIYTLSTENLNRSSRELHHIFKEVRKRVENLLTKDKIHSQEVKIKFLGKHHSLPSNLLKAFNKVMNATKGYQNKVVNFLIAYGGKYELVNAFNKLLSKAMKQAKKEAENRIKVTPKMVKNHLMVKEPLDLIIRTGKEHRLSNFMLWQASYAELYTSDKLWPAFEKEDFYDALQWYKDRQRRYGK